MLKQALESYKNNKSEGDINKLLQNNDEGKKEKRDKARKKYEEKDPQKVRERVNKTMKNRTLRVKYLCEKYGSEIGISTKKYVILDPNNGNVVNEFIKMELARCKANICKKF